LAEALNELIGLIINKNEVELDFRKYSVQRSANEQSSKRKVGVVSSSELSRHYRSQKHRNGLKFADGVQRGTPPSPIVKQKNGQQG